ncbi:MAG TPA: DUF1566 domain-containing protein [Myxococcota bacterium]|nr:DUF1566 domain-containing protein [Myxococcota bacterium]HRY94945.1 DUF1566 domain-containing protein [Myxococcota bacterium]HSA22607.1 DUF1566 domain-containing protein [Myxococcota bacterium]
MRSGPLPILSSLWLAACGLPACERALPVVPFQPAAELVYVSGGGGLGEPEQTGVVGSELPVAFTVEARDEHGNPVQGAAIHFEIVADQVNGKLLDASSVVSDAAGRAASRYQLGERVGENHVRAYAGGLEDQPVEFHPAGLHGSPHALRSDFVTPEAGVVSQPLAEPVVVEVVDLFGNGIAGIEVLFSASDGGRADPDSAVSDAAGQVSSTWTLGPESALAPDFQWLRASALELQPLEFTCQADHGPAVLVEIVAGDHQVSGLGAHFTLPLAVRLSDAFDNPIDGAEVAWTVVEGQAEISRSVDQEVATDGDGQVFRWLTPLALGAIRVEASYPGAAPATFSETCSDEVPHLVLVSPQSPAQAVAGGPLELTLRVEDQAGAPLEGWTVMCLADAALGETPGDFPVDQVLTDAAGLAVLTMILGPKAGAGLQWARCFVPAFPDDEVRLDVTGLADVPALLTALGGDGQSGSFGQPLPGPLMVGVQDRFGNPVPGWGVSWSSATGGTVTPNPSPTDGAGVAQGVARLGSDPGVPEQTFTAEASGHQLTFHAQGLGLLARMLEPACLWPGYPDPADPDPAATQVPFRLLGAGFEAGDLIVWDAAEAQELITPDQLLADEIQFSLGADRFLPGLEGELQVLVRAAAGGETAPLAFRLRRANPDSGQGVDQCTLYDGPSDAWSWVHCDTIALGAALYGQDGHHHLAAEQPDYALEQPGSVLDRSTGLVWARCPVGLGGADCEGGQLRPSTQAEALAHCADLSLDGADDWRLPTLVELLSLLDLGTQFPAADTAAFPGTPEACLWTREAYAPDAAQAHRVDFDGGGADYAPVAEPGTYARCVRAGFPADGARWLRSATTPAEPVVDDFQGGLTWQGCPAGRGGADCSAGSPLALDWAGALAHCEGLSWAGHDDWRLPQVKELASLLVLSLDWPAVDPALFPRTPATYAWSSTSKVGTFEDWAWRVGMGDGYIGAMTKSQSALTHVRCVRDAD